MILHAAKYPHCAVNGILFADATKIKEGAKNQELDIVDSYPLFHHSHYVSPMAEVALTLIETMAQAENCIVAGYYAACENFRDNTVDKCPGQKIAEKIAEYFPSAVFIVVDNKRIIRHLDSPAIKLHKYSEGKWKLKEFNTNQLFPDRFFLHTTSQLLQGHKETELVDFDNYLDDVSKDWNNIKIRTYILDDIKSEIELIKKNKEI
ncbi:hypothetical protein evm_007998 [Chilo suppressalis]|nr:hypothetical protein evm_007998 [Chilo suppressalis]